jgi:hypothetical protein
MSRPLFPELEPLPSEPDPRAPPDAGDPAAAGAALGASEDPRQIALFSDAAVVGRDLQLALAKGDFEEARRARQDALETFGPAGPAAGMEFLDRLGPDLWERGDAEVLAVWRDVDGQVADRPVIRTQVRDGIFERLSSRRTAAGLADAHPEVLGPLTAALLSREGSTAFPLVRTLVRDALLRGHPLDGRDFGHDAPVAELLAEHLAPAWIACLGAIRRAWTAPSMTSEELATFASDASDTTADGEADRAFWMCLRVARSPDPPEPLLHEARRRMKRLNPGLHALYMGRAATT